MFRHSALKFCNLDSFPIWWLTTLKWLKSLHFLVVSIWPSFPSLISEIFLCRFQSLSRELKDLGAQYISSASSCAGPHCCFNFKWMPALYPNFQVYQLTDCPLFKMLRIYEFLESRVFVKIYGWLISGNIQSPKWVENLIRKQKVSDFELFYFVLHFWIRDSQDVFVLRALVLGLSSTWDLVTFHDQKVQEKWPVLVTERSGP